MNEDAKLVKGSPEWKAHRSELQKAYYRRHIEARKAYAQAYAEKHEDTQRERRRQYYEAHKAEILARNAARYAAKKPEDVAYRQQYRAAHAGDHSAYCKDYYQSKRGEILARNRTYYKTHRAECTARATKRYLGVDMPEEKRIAMLAGQDGRCAICSTPMAVVRTKDGPPAAHIDHDHVTGKIRGMLCPTCNMGLGCFDDNKELLRKAAAYLDSHKEPADESTLPYEPPQVRQIA